MITINPKTKEIYSTSKVLKGFEVNGGYFCETSHATLKNAEKEKALREAINKKFPFIPPLSKKELKNRNNNV